jgi:hypothetical protein
MMVDPEDENTLGDVLSAQPIDLDKRLDHIMGEEDLIYLSLEILLCT